MFKPLPLFLGLRYAVARGDLSGRRRSFVSFLSTIAMAGLALGSAVLVLVLSVINGFERELRERVLGVLPQLVIDTQQPWPDWRVPAALLTSLQGVRGVAPLVAGDVLLATTDAVHAARLAGVLPEVEPNVSILPRFLHEPGLAALKPGGYVILLGAGLAKTLQMKTGDSVTVILPEAVVTPLGVFTRRKRFTVGGVFQTGADLDDSAAYVHLVDAQKLYRLGDGVSSLRIALDDLFRAREIGAQAIGQLPGPALRARDWSRTHGALYRAIVLQKTTMLILLSLVIAVAAFNVVSSLIMIVTDKQAEIAILRSMGMSRRGVVGVFLVLGTLVGLLGVLIGLGLGALASLYVADAVRWLEAQWQLDLLNQYFVRYLPSQLLPGDLWLVGGIGFGLALLASLYPARRAARLMPAEVLRYE